MVDNFWAGVVGLDEIAGRLRAKGNSPQGVSGDTRLHFEAVCTALPCQRAAPGPRHKLRPQHTVCHFSKSQSQAQALGQVNERCNYLLC